MRYTRFSQNKMCLLLISVFDIWRAAEKSNEQFPNARQDALDAPELLLYCAEYIVRNLDAVLVLGCESTNCCLLEASGELVSGCSAMLKSSSMLKSVKIMSNDAHGFNRKTCGRRNTSIHQQIPMLTPGTYDFN